MHKINRISLLCLESLLSLTSFVVQTLVGQNWTSYAFHDSLPGVWLSCFTGADLLVGELTSEESACRPVLPVVDGSVLSGSDLASWHSLGGEGGWESVLHESVEWSADWLSSWFLWVDWNLLSESDPVSALESVPDLVDVLEDVSIMMPVALPPGPSSVGEALLGWSPVVPFAIVESIPDLLSW